MTIGNQRFIGQIDTGGLPFRKVAEAIELLGTEVAPVMRREIASVNAIPPVRGCL